MKRITVPKKIRFEVFKRDKFRCQYCGRPAPEVLLEVDHINPVAAGGDNDILNLITSCDACNSGKGAARLTDNTILEKTRQQLEELEEKRQQIELLLEWKKGLRNIKAEANQKAIEFWHELAPGLACNANGEDNIARWIKKYGLSCVLDAMQIAADSYLKFDPSGVTTRESWEHAFAKIPGICFMSGKSEDDKSAYYVRGILKSRFPQKAESNYRSAELLRRIQGAMKFGVTVNELINEAKKARSWAQFETWLDRESGRERKPDGCIT